MDAALERTGDMQISLSLQETIRGAMKVSDTVLVQFDLRYMGGYITRRPCDWPRFLSVSLIYSVSIIRPFCTPLRSVANTT